MNRHSIYAFGCVFSRFGFLAALLIRLAIFDSGIGKTGCTPPKVHLKEAILSMGLERMALCH